MINTLDLDEKKLSELELRGALHSMIEKIESNKLEAEDWLDNQIFICKKMNLGIN